MSQIIDGTSQWKAPFGRLLSGSRLMDSLQVPLPLGPPRTLPMTLANAAYLGITRFANDRNKENWATGSDVDKANLIRAVYQQVLGRQYVI